MTAITRTLLGAVLLKKLVIRSKFHTHKRENSVLFFGRRIFYMAEFTHFNEEGRAKMVDVSDKPETARTALAHSSITVSKEIFDKITNHEMKKGDVLAVAQVAAVMAAKKTWDIIPMCHPIPLTGVNISFGWEEDQTGNFQLHIEAAVKTKGNTGVEMEALTAASACALTVYDMCKAVDKGMVIGPTYLVEKTGGKNGDFRRNEQVK
jgi:cyclic pyranopterin monophosphate synthase